MKLSNELYDFIKKYGLAILVGFAGFIVVFGEQWGVPYAEKISATVLAFVEWILYVINHSSKEYFKDKQIVSSVNNYDTEDPNEGIG